MFGACTIQSVDFRSSTTTADYDTIAPCEGRERMNPSTGQCEPCVYAEPHPTLVCPCDYVFHASPFPFCEGVDADYSCLPCQGDITSCRGWDADLGRVTNCDLFEACCDALAVHSPTSACCVVGETAVCDGFSGTFECKNPSCCGALCPAGNNDCLSGICNGVTQRCEPACDLGEFCNVRGGCVCEANPG